MENIVVEATPRTSRGKNPARQLRRQGMVPGVVYGGQQPPTPLSVDPRMVERLLHTEAGQNAVFTLTIKGQGQTPAMIREWQVDPVKGLLMHVDFVRIALDARLKVKVPVEVRGEPVGVKQQGGVLEQVLREVEVECLPGDIPDELVLDVSELAIGKGLRVSDLRFDAGKVRMLNEADEMIVHVVAPRAEEEPKPAEEAAVAAVAAPAEPELIRKRKPEEEAEAEAEGGGEKKKKEE